jgi:hypothetical protein
MGTSDVKPEPYSTLTGNMKFISVDWKNVKSQFKEVAAGK